MDTDVKVEGLYDLLQKINVAKDMALTATAAAMAVVTKKAAEDAQRNHTFRNRTGNLESSIIPLPVETDGSQVVGAVNATASSKAGMEYAPYVEFGTSRSAPYPFLRPAVEANKDFMTETVAKTVERALGSAAKVER